MDKPHYGLLQPAFVVAPPTGSPGVTRIATIHPRTQGDIAFWNILKQSSRFKIVKEVQFRDGRNTYWLVTFVDYDPSYPAPANAPAGVFDVTESQ